jgi:Na+-transporting NADH:ubiquinone oxidoreductase subunit NqrE
VKCFFELIVVLSAILGASSFNAKRGENVGSEEVQRAATGAVAAAAPAGVILAAYRIHCKRESK